MNVKTGCKGYPKQALLEVVGEIKGKTEAARKQRGERRGKSIGFHKTFEVSPGNEVTLVAGGNNKKVPLLLIASASSMLPGKEHKKTWTTIDASGEEVVNELVTAQTEMHELYRLYMNLVDLHNKLRQGVTSMADAWHTQSWVERHFAELLGFVEVNIFKTLSYFEKEKYSHNEFRARLAWSLMTLGKVPYPTRESLEKGSHGTPLFASSTPSLASPTGPSRTWHVMVHRYAKFEREKEKHACAYCGMGALQYCISCDALGRGKIPVCGRKSGRDCVDRHARGEDLRHSSWIQSVGKEAWGVSLEYSE